MNIQLSVNTAQKQDFIFMWQCTTFGNFKTQTGNKWTWKN